MSEYSVGFHSDGPVILKDGNEITLRQAISELNHLSEMASAGLELAEYASYSEIIGSLGNNRRAIRKWCDVVFKLKREAEANEYL